MVKKVQHATKKVEETLKFPKCLHLQKLLLAYVIVLLMPYNFRNYNIFISLKIAVIFKVDKIVVPLYIYRVFDNSVNNFHGKLERTKLKRKVL